MEKYIDLIVAILAGLVTAIPLVVQLVKYVKKLAKEKNWGGLLQILMGYMSQAETMFATGAERKEWVLAMIQQTSIMVDFDVNLDVIATLIDRLCDLTKVVNADYEKIEQ